MRAFIAIDLTEENKQALSQLQSQLKQPQADVKWVEAANIHLTLKFLGEISEQQAQQVKQVLDKIVSQFKSYELSLAGLGAFPKLDYPRVIWVGIEKGKTETIEIVKRLEEELLKLGFPKEDREFSAHLTIGRVRSGKNKEALKEKIQSLNAELRTPNSQLISSINFYQSTLTPKGPIYTRLYSAIFQKSS